MNRLQKAVAAIAGLIDRAAAAAVEAKFPSTVELLGAIRQVVYRYDSWYQKSTTATITLTCDEAERLQEENLKNLIPGGTPITVTLSDQGFTEISSDSPLAIRQKIRETARSIAWNKVCYSSNAPWSGKGFETTELALGQELPLLPEPVQYGEYRDIVFTAHAARNLQQMYRYEGSICVYFWQVNCVWHNGERDATTADTQAVEQWAKLWQEEQDKKILPELKAAAEAAREKIRAFEAREGFSDLEYDMRRKVEWQGSPPSDAATIRQWTQKAEAFIAQIEAALAPIMEKKERRRAYEEMARNAGSATAHILVTDEGQVGVNAGKSSKMGGYEVLPNLGEAFYNGTSLDAGGSYSYWIPIPMNQSVTARDYSARGNINSEIEFIVPAGRLTQGVWAVAKNHQEKTVFFPAIHYSGGEIIPEKFEVVESRRAPAPSSPTKPTSLEDSVAALQRQLKGEATVEYTADSDGYFSCDCGRMNRLTKSERKARKDGTTVNARCDCGRVGTIKK